MNDHGDKPNNGQEPNKDDKSKPPHINMSFPPPRYDQRKRDLGVISTDANGILTRLFRNIGYDLTNNQYFSNIAWKRMMDKYLDDMINVNPEVNRQNERGNFTKALQAPRMSWKTLVKTFKLYRFKKVRIIIVATHEDDQLSVHSTTASLKPVGPDDHDVEVNVDVIEEAVRDAVERQKQKQKKDGAA